MYIMKSFGLNQVSASYQRLLFALLALSMLGIKVANAQCASPTILNFGSPSGSSGNISWTSNYNGAYNCGSYTNIPFGGSTFTITYAAPVNNPTFVVFGDNTDDVETVKVNGAAYSLSNTTATIGAPSVCGPFGGVGIVFSGGNYTGGDSPAVGNFSTQTLTLNATNVTTITITHIAGAGSGIAGAGYCSLTQAAAATPVASVTQNPTSPGTSTGIINLTATTGQTPYPATTPVSVTYTTPGGGTATFTGSTNGSGQIIIPNLPAGQYGPFVVRVNGGPPSNPSNTVMLVDPAPACAANAGTITRQ